MRTGLDLSCWNNVDMSEIKTDFAILRVGYGVSYDLSQRDSSFDMFYDGLHGNIPLGAYYYAYSTNREQGIAEAENCLSYMGDKKFELPIYYDLEEARNTREGAEGFIQRIRDAGLKAGIYCSTSYYASEFNGIDCDSVWLAEWGRNDGQVPSSTPDFHWDIWQYTSEGRVPGIDGRVDLNLADDKVIYGGDTPSPVPPTPEVKNKIAEYQEWLNTFENVEIAVDGIFGEDTKKAATIALQTLLRDEYQVTDITIDGVWGDETRDACERVCLQEGDNSNMVKCVKGMLICYDFTPLAVSTDFDPAMEQKVKDYQCYRGLVEDGIVGVCTLTVMFS